MRSRYLFLLLLAAGTALSYRAYARPLVICDVSVIPMTSEQVLEHQDVQLDEGRFVAIRPHQPSSKSHGQTIDGTGKFLIPGLSDLHVHFRGSNDIQPDLLFLYTANGISTVLCMSGGSQVLRLRGETEKGTVLGPRIFSTSPIVGILSPTPATAEKGREMVRQFKADGYDFIKVYNLIPEESYWGIIEEAKTQNIPVVGHAVRSVGIEGAIKAGQHIAHIEEFLYGYFNTGRDESRIAPLAQRLKDAHISVIATLIVYHNILRQLDDIDAVLNSPGMKYVPEELKRTYYPEKNDYLKRFDKKIEEEMLRPDFAFMCKLTKAFEDAGVQLLAGTDAATEIVVPGWSLHQELQELVAAGLTPYQALETATTRAAAFVGHAKDFGSIETGKAAEAILLNANPLEDISNTQTIAGVFVKGQWLSRADIDKRLDAIATRVKASTKTPR